MWRVCSNQNKERIIIVPDPESYFNWITFLINYVSLDIVTVKWLIKLKRVLLEIKIIKSSDQWSNSKCSNRFIVNYLVLFGVVVEEKREAFYWLKFHKTKTSQKIHFVLSVEEAVCGWGFQGQLQEKKVILPMNEANLWLRSSNISWKWFLVADRTIPNFGVISTGQAKRTES